MSEWSFSVSASPSFCCSRHRGVGAMAIIRSHYCHAMRTTRNKLLCFSILWALFQSANGKPLGELEPVQPLWLDSISGQHLVNRMRMLLTGDWCRRDSLYWAVFSPLLWAATWSCSTYGSTAQRRLSLAAISDAVSKSCLNLFQLAPTRQGETSL